jgi:hypothetical protein
MGWHILKRVPQRGPVQGAPETPAGEVYGSLLEAGPG